MSSNNQAIKILGVRIDAVQIPEIIKKMEAWIAKGDLHNYIVAANVHTVITARSDNLFRKAVEESSLAMPDGFPLVVFNRMHGYPLKKRAYGPDLLRDFLEATEGKYSHFFYGSTEETLDKLIKNIKEKFPGTKIAGLFSPPFRSLSQEEDDEIIKKINLSSADVLWVGIGCPKQELWMHGHKQSLKVPVMVGVGAAFDFIAGTKPQAPGWMKNNGLEWLFRLIAEPRRLWRRYIIDNFTFVCLALPELIQLSLKRINHKAKV